MNSANKYPEHIERVITEKAELDEKLEKLIEFKYTGMFSRLPFAEAERLNTQGHIMCAYSAILGERIRAATPDRNQGG